MKHDIEEFPSINGQMKGQLTHLRNLISVFVSNETVRNHMLNSISEVIGLTERTYGIVQAHRYPSIAEDLLEKHLQSD